MTRPGPAADRPGLQAARTRLAWRRSLLGALVGGLLALRDVVLVERWPAAGSVAALATLASALAVVWVAGRRRATALGGRSVPAEDAAPLSPRWAGATAGGVVALAAVALATLF